MRCAFLDALDEQAISNPNVVAFENSCGESITHAQLKNASDALAC